MITKNDLSFLSGYSSKIADIYNEILSGLFSVYGYDIDILAIGSIVKSEFSYNVNQKRETLSDIEIVVLTEIKAGSEKLNRLSTEIANRWFLESELFHVDIRETSKQELLNRKNLLPFQKMVHIFGDTDISEIEEKAKIAVFPFTDVLEKNIYQYAIFYFVHENKDVAIYLITKLILALAQSDDKDLVKLVTNVEKDSSALWDIKVNLNFHRFDRDMETKYARLLQNIINEKAKDSFFEKSTLIKFIHSDVKPDNDFFSLATLQDFLFFYYGSSDSPQITYFKNIYAHGVALHR